MAFANGLSDLGIKGKVAVVTAGARSACSGYFSIPVCLA